MEILDLTHVMQSILLTYLRGYTLWVSFQTDQEKVAALDQKWALEYGTHEPAWKRHHRKSKGAPNSLAFAGKVFGQPGRAEVILLATPEARKVAHNGPYHAFLREQWRDDPPRFSHFEVVHMPREANGKLVWTWKIRKKELDQMEKFFINTAGLRDIETLARELNRTARLYPMFSGVRSQLRRVFRHVARRCDSLKIPYRGPDPEALPVMRFGTGRPGPDSA